MKTIIHLLIMLSLIQNLAFAQEKEFIISTGVKGSTWHVAGEALAKILTNNLEPKYGYRFKALPSSGSHYNINMIEEGKVHFATTSALFSLMAVQGSGIFKNDKKRNLTMAMYLWRDAVNYVVRKDFAKSGNIMDMKNAYGKPFALGLKDTDFKISAGIILGSLGVSSNQIKNSNLDYIQSGDALLKKRIVGLNALSYPPVSIVDDLYKIIPNDIRYLEFDNSQLKAINQKYPLWSPFIIPSGTYPNQPKEIKTICQPTVLVASKKLPKEVVYQVLKVIYDNLDTLHEMNSALKEITKKSTIEDLPINLHRGAMKYYRDNNVKMTIPIGMLYKVFG